MSFSLLLVIHPFFSTGEMLLPPLPLARTVALLKKAGWKKVDYLDFRTDPDCQGIIGPEIKPLLTYRYQFVPELYELPLIISLLEKYSKKEDLTKVGEKETEIITKWALERGVLPSKALDYLENTISFVRKKINIFADYQQVMFVIDEQNIYISLLNSLILKQLNPNIRIIFAQKDFFQSEKIRNVFALANFSDCFIGYSEKEILNLVGHPDLFAKKIETEDIFSNLKKYNKKSLPIKIKKESAEQKNTLREPEEILKELNILSSEFSQNNFYFYDLPLNYSQEWFADFCSTLNKQKQSFNWFGNFKQQITEKELFLAKQTGLHSVRINADFSTEKINPPDFFKMIQFLLEEKIYTRLNLIIGSPGETENNFSKKTEAVQILLENLKNSSQKKYFQLLFTNFQLSDLINDSLSLQQRGIKLKTWEESFTFPDIYQEICQKIICSFEIEGITTGQIWQRLSFFRQLQKFF